MLSLTISRRSSDASTSSATPSLAASSASSPSSSSSWSSLGPSYDLLEPIEGAYPRDLVEYSSSPMKRPSPSRKHSHGSRPACTLHSRDERLDSIFSFPRNHTKHEVCPRHGIVHDPALALPERDSREATDSDHSSSGSCSSSLRSNSSSRSIKCALWRIASHIKNA
ncbi:hypothetical protein JCM10908_001937 [Rhodotorula pacifica]|uniref:uncharacterized protein n=1 Tax=Rhodotorula pacifica TaxID=1495444 RepID=UPI00316EB693